MLVVQPLLRCLRHGKRSRQLILAQPFPALGIALRKQHRQQTGSLLNAGLISAVTQAWRQEGLPEPDDPARGQAAVSDWHTVGASVGVHLVPGRVPHRRRHQLGLDLPNRQRILGICG